MLIKKFEEQVQETPHHIAVKTGNQSISYEELNRYANGIAHLIEAVWPKHREEGNVGLLLEHGIQMIAAILGALKAGKTYVPLAVEYPYNRISYMLENSESSLLITNSKNEEKAKKLSHENNIQLLDLDKNAEAIFASDNHANPTREIKGEKLAYILYTSGSTGKPKGVMQNHQNVLYFIRNWTQRFSITSADRITLLASFCHDASIPDLYSALLNGATLYPYDVRDRDDNLKLSEFLLQEKITVWHSVPSLYNFFVNTLTGEEHFDHLRCIMLGGEPLRWYEIEMFKKHFAGAIFANIYGQTEATVNSIWTIGADDPISRLVIGEPLDNTRVFVVDKEGNEVDRFETGEILVACPHISPGYWKSEELTKKSFSLDPEYGLMYWTGDLGRLHPDGNIEFMGRKDFQVKIRGFRVEIGEIETTLLRMPEIKEAVVVAKESETGNNYLCAFLKAEKEMKVSELRNFLSRELPDYMIPLHFIQLEKIPLTPTGKVDRKSLSVLEIDPLKSSSIYVESRTDLEKIIAGVWKEVLNLEKVGVHDNIFEIGGNSFDIIKINTKLSGILQKNIPIVKLFEYPTIETLAGYLNPLGDRKEAGENNQITVNSRKERGLGAGIAVIGMAGRFPGAGNIEKFWENLKNGVESISFFTDEELIESGLSPELVRRPNYVKAKGVLEDIEFFDAPFFNFTPREAAVMDPQLRIFHECAWEALEHAGYSSSNYDGLIGVYAGNAFNIGWLAQVFTQGSSLVGGLEKGFLNNHLSTYISYKLDLKGPSVTIRTACSTSLVAVHMACQGLLLSECDMALAGGVSILIPKKSGYLYREGMIYSPDGHVRAFDANSKGTVFGDGVGCVVLKRLEEAVADGDYIYAVIKGSAINNDGIRKVGYTAPGISGQREVVRAAQRAAGVEPESISFIETHGTGTILGDAVEIEALNQVFTGNKKKYCAIASVKSNIGHLNAASGITGFIKTVLSLKYKLITPSLHFETPNPEIDFENSPFYVNTKLTQWKSDSYPLRAGVSSFGFGGTNAHVILEEAPTVAGTGLTTIPAKGREHKIILLSARTGPALDKMTKNVVEFFKIHTDAQLSDVAYTLQVGRRAFPHRRMLVCSRMDEAIASLRSLGPGKVFSFFTKEEKPLVVFMFPGQGSQYVNMGVGLYISEPVFREEMDRCFEILKSLTGFDIKEILYPFPGEITQAMSEKINQTEITQPVLFVIEYCLARLLMKWGIKPNAMIGHSIGEYAAASLSGVLSLEAALTLVVLRGKLIQGMPGGAMVSVPLPEEEILQLLNPQLALAAVNSTSSCVVSGPHEAIDAFGKELKERGYEAKFLHTSHAFHSQMIEPILKEFEEEVSKITFNPPSIPFISNLTGKWISAEDACSPHYWAMHIRNTVRFADGLSKLLREHDTIFVEVGPGRTLSTFVNQHGDKKSGHTITNFIRHPNEDISDNFYLMNKIGQCWLHGLVVDWSGFYDDEKRRRIPLPTYPFERQHYWSEGGFYKTGAVNEMLRSSSAKKTDIADWFYVPTWRRTAISRPKSESKIENKLNWLLFIDSSGIGVRLANRLIQEGHNVVMVKEGTGFARLKEGKYSVDPGKADDYNALLNELSLMDRIPHRVVHLLNVTRNANDLNPGNFCGLLYLAQVLEKRNLNSRIQVMVLTDGMQEVIGGDLLYLQKVVITGYVQIIPREYPNIRCRSIDIDIPGSGVTVEDRLVENILTEIKSDIYDAEMFTAYRNNYRWVKTFESVRLENSLENAAHLRKDGVYLITGGSGGICLILAEHLLKTANAKLILVENTASIGEGGGGGGKKFGEFEKAGAEILEFRADMMDMKQMKELISRAKVRFGKINGVIHCAGVPGENVSILDVLLKDEGMDFFILCSSIRSIIPSPGEIDQCCAYSFIDQFAYYKASRSTIPFITVSINWDELLEPSEVCIVFERILAMAEFHPQVVVSTIDLQYRIQEKHGSYPEFPVEGPGYCRPELSSPYAAPENETERMLAAIWQGFFGFKQVGLHDDFFELGGDSLKAMNIISEIHKELGVEVPITEVFTRPTINGISEYILEHVGQRNWEPITLAEKKEYYKLSPAQRRLYILQQMNLNCINYNVPQNVVLRGALNLGKLESIFSQLIERYEILRTSFEIVNEEPVQKLHHKVEFALAFHDMQGLEPGEVEKIIDNFVRPFDLSKVPLLRVGLIKQEEETHILMMDMHHILTDEISMGIFLKALVVLYIGGELSPLRLQYKDYAEWQNRKRESAVIKKQEEYWLNRFKGDIPRLNLVADYPRPSVQRFEGDKIFLEIHNELLNKLRKLMLDTGTTLYMVLITAYNILLSKHTNQDDIIIGTPIAGRRHTDLDNVIGMFVNMLTIRNHPSEHKTFSTFLKEVKETALEAYENQDYQFDDLIAAVGLERELNQQPLVNVVFQAHTMETASGIDESTAECPLTIARYDSKRKQIKYDLVFEAYETQEKILIMQEFSTTLFKSSTIEKLMKRYIEILGQVVENQYIQLKDILISHDLTAVKPAVIATDFNFNIN